MISKKTWVAALVVLSLVLCLAAVGKGDPGRPDGGPGGRDHEFGPREGWHQGPPHHRMMGGLLEPGVDVKVEKLKNGATITLTSDDPKVAQRVQTRAEIMRLMHELHQQEAASRPPKHE